uniref:Uncharacterized protein n=1 Tax=Micrurus lemniscatus lemniscatus TaxID=129467 RepID=A0A2D4JQ36_MICLE
MDLYACISVLTHFHLVDVFSVLGASQSHSGKVGESTNQIKSIKRLLRVAGIVCCCVPILFLTLFLNGGCRESPKTWVVYECHQVSKPLTILGRKWSPVTQGWSISISAFWRPALVSQERPAR